MTHTIEILGTFLFACAILHTFCTGFLHKLPKRYLFLAEVELVFAIWAALFLFLMTILQGIGITINYFQSLSFHEPLFVFAMMLVTSTPPVRIVTSKIIERIARTIPRLPFSVSFYFVALTVGPLLGSLITEPAAMTVIALILRDRYFNQNTSDRFKYKTLALLFVNISIGGVLTHFAAPPVVMVAKTWGWDTMYMFLNFGIEATLAVFLNTLLVCYILKKELSEIPMTSKTTASSQKIQFKESLFVALFLAGLVVLGKVQAWWLKPLLASLGEFSLFASTTLLTAITDNAALTYLGAQVPGLAEPLKQALVQGAVTGGGLTVIANAPNPAGYGILKDSFGQDGIKASRLFFAALIPTLIAAILFRL